ncbi:hypothetical protein FNV43_RR20992 [Rhamnella rubrinervis]|uniref:Uncharacterized protein n=1 Tax=Rhamnella rubrinervis TaxID=2594499 RepID=A0A8K0DX02_9ROSA|nr:hypothetical protein FNV43_RR20992 [Rhamnella rubrinervis]
MAPVDHSKSNKPGGAKLKVTAKAIGGDSTAALVEGGSNGPQLQSKYGLRVIQLSSASEGNKVAWIKVKKVGSGNKGIGSGRTMATCTSPRKSKQVPTSLDESSNKAVLPASNKGSGNGISILTRTSCGKVQEQTRPVDNKLNSSEVPTAKSGSGSTISITRRMSPTKVMQLRGRLEDRLEGPFKRNPRK